MKRENMEIRTKGMKRTLRDFENVLFDLLSVKSFEEITVQEICEKASYPRATFYNYFEDKYDLLQSCFQSLASLISLDDYLSVKEEERLFVYYDRIYNFTNEKRERIEKILLHNSEVGYMYSSFTNFMKTKLRQIFENCLHARTLSLPIPLLADHYSNTLLLVWQYCYFNPTPLSLETAHDYLKILIGNLA